MDFNGKMYTHRSMSNTSNTIHGIYLTFNLSGVNGDNRTCMPPKCDLFGIKEIKREWVPLVDLEVLNDNGIFLGIGTKDTKLMFISGFIVRKLAKEGNFCT